MGGQRYCLPLETLLGEWLDSKGNDVSVSRKNSGSDQQLDVELRPQRQESKRIHLKAKSLGQRGGFECGHYTMDTGKSCSDMIVWNNRNSKKDDISIWKRKQDSSNARARHGGDARQDHRCAAGRDSSPQEDAGNGNTPREEGAPPASPQEETAPAATPPESGIAPVASSWRSRPKYVPPPMRAAALSLQKQQEDGCSSSSAGGPASRDAAATRTESYYTGAGGDGWQPSADRRQPAGMSSKWPNSALRWGRSDRGQARPPQGLGEDSQVQQLPRGPVPSSAEQGASIPTAFGTSSSSAQAADRDSSGAHASRWPGGGGQKGRSAGKWGEGLPRHVTISKTLTQILRHKAIDLGVGIQADGFCDVDEVIAVHWLQELHCTLGDVDRVVRESDKKRFELREDGHGRRLIRAVQGHSIKLVDDKLLLSPLSLDCEGLPVNCVHGTYRRHYESIKKLGGLLAGGAQGQSFRNHVHFSPSAPGDRKVISGMRYDCEVAIWIDLRMALKDGVPFYRSANEVILSPGIDGLVAIKYFIEVKDLRTKECLYKKDFSA